MTLSRRLSLFASLALAACAAEGDPDDAELVSDEATTGSPCGIGTRVASLPTPTGTTADFCVFPDDLHGMRESGPLDARAYLVTLPPELCLDDIHARLAPGQPVPQALIDTCRERTTAMTLAAESGEPDGLETDGEAGPQPEPMSHYCSADGDLEFDDERCSWIEWSAGNDVWWDSVWWCITSPWSSVQKTASSQIGHNVNQLEVVVAACSGTTEAKLKAKVGGDWNTYVHDSVSSNYWASWWLQSAWIDRDMRFNATSDDGWFRNSGYFGDFIWP